MKYIMILEDGEILKSATITDEDKETCCEGLLDIIDTQTMQAYYNGSWYDLKEWRR